MPRKKADIFYIYKTTCNITGRYYIGMHVTNNINDGYLGSGLRLRHSIRKHGKENHVREILEFLPSKELLIKREQQIITTELIAEYLCMNLREGGKGGFTSEQQKLNNKKSLARQKFLRENNPEWVFKKSEKISISNKKLFDEGIFKRDWGKDWTGCNHSDETKRLMSENKKGSGVGKENSQFGTCWITKNGENKKRTITYLFRNRLG